MRPSVASLVASAVASTGASPVAIKSPGRTGFPHRGGECGGAILPTTLHHLGVCA
jgi:hypothetical protein